ncbi:Talin-1, partial [Xenoophorus captivus]
ITNYDEYSLVRDIGEEKKEETTGTLKKDKTLLRDDKKMEKLKQKLHTDDECKIHINKLHTSCCLSHRLC